MIRRFRVFNMFLILLFAFVSASLFFAQTRNRPATQPAASDFKVTYKVTMGGAGGGQTTESTTMIKGPRERSETHLAAGFDQVNILQCDLKRTIQISDSARKYIITPIESGDTPVTANAVGANTSVARRGGIVTYTTSAVDTVERKEMFGFTARHVKSTTAIESSPDACSQVKQRTELDGWYIDLTVALDCQLGHPPAMPERSPRPGGCQDKMRFRRTGTARTGYPLIETMTMYGEGGQVSFTTTKEVVELSREPLDSALFDIPAGYSQASSMQELYGMPSMAQMMAGGPQGETGNTGSSRSNSAETKKPGTIRIGVVQINNKAGKPIPLDSLRARLLAQIESAGLEAVLLNGLSQMEAEAEAMTKQCDFILLTDLATLKTSKLGGMFGRVTGVEGVAKTESKVEFKLFAVGESSPRLQSSATAKEDGEEASAGTAIDAEARAVSSEARKKGRG